MMSGSNHDSSATTFSTFEHTMHAHTSFFLPLHRAQLSSLLR